ncbi:propanediol utilization protein [Candidatus Uhrbacteria bacterium]|nr:propanediol utilization protein [Candidatus Uhrbacteria bacterium]
MSRPIPVEIIPSHVHLSEAHHAALFGPTHAATIVENLSQTGQFAYAERVEVYGRLKRSVPLRVLGPCRRTTQVELTPTEAQLLGLTPPVARSGDMSEAVGCRLVGPHGEVEADAVVIIPKPHLHCSDTEAASLHVVNGKTVSVEVLGDNPYVLDDVVVRVHPSYRLRLHVHPDIARTHWMTGVVHARIRDKGL